MHRVFIGRKGGRTMPAKNHVVVLIRHRVANYRRWREMFDGARPARTAHGCRSRELFRLAGQPKELVVMLSCSDLRRARQFVESDDLRETLARGGVTDRPDIYILEEVDTPDE
jgi:hypothetical protein